MVKVMVCARESRLVQVNAGLWRCTQNTIMLVSKPRMKEHENLLG